MRCSDFTLAPSLRKSGQLVCNQVSTEKDHAVIKLMPYERQWPFEMEDISVYGAAVNT